MSPYSPTILENILRLIVKGLSKPIKVVLFNRYRKMDEIKKSLRIWTPVFLSQATYSTAILNHLPNDKSFEQDKIDLAFADDK